MCFRTIYSEAQARVRAFLHERVPDLRNLYHLVVLNIFITCDLILEAIQKGRDPGWLVLVSQSYKSKGMFLIFT